MLIWLGVVATVLALVGMLILWQLYIHVSSFLGLSNQVENACEAMARTSHDNLQAIENAIAMFGKKLRDENDRAAEKLAEANKDWLQGFVTTLRNDLAERRAQVEHEVSDRRAVALEFSKSERELAENLAVLLREIRVAKQLAQGSVAVVEQNVIAIDKLWQLYETIRGGPRTPAKIAPTDADAAAAEAGLTDAQQADIEAQLVNAASRMRQGRGEWE